MPNDKQIPLLKTNSYRRSYFKPDEDHHLVPASSGIQHFEIKHRCIWNNFIPVHRLDFYMVFIVTKGEGLHSFGLQKHYIKETMLCFIGPAMISSWQSETDAQQGFFCSCSEDFFTLGRENKYFLHELPFFQVDGTAVLELSEEQAQYYLSLFGMMKSEYENSGNYSDNILRSQLQLLLNKAYSQYLTGNEQAPGVNRAALRLLKSITAVYEKDFKTLNNGKTVQLKKVADYALELGVSQNHLNDTLKAITGRSAGQLIRNQLIKLATMCLINSTKTISEIAYALGFEDPSYFARYYKKQTGQVPSGLRRSNNL